MNKPKMFRRLRDETIASLREEIAEHAPEPLPAHVWVAAAAQSGYSRRHLQRMVTQGSKPPIRSDQFEVSPAVSDEVFMCNGNLAAARGRLMITGMKVPSETTFRRKVMNGLGTTVLAMAKRGQHGVRAVAMYLPAEDGEAGETYLLDHTELPIWVIPSGHLTAVRPWLTAVMDHCSRYVLSWVLTFGRPGELEVRAALMSAFTVRLAPDGVTKVGGIPDRCVWDRGLEFLSDLITESCLRLDIMPTPLPGYSPHLKGRLERFWAFLKGNALPPLPGFSEIDGPNDLRGHSLSMSHALSEEAFCEELEVWMDRFITEHVMRPMNCTPLQAWQKSTRPIRTVPAEKLWQDFLKSTRNPKVGKMGVRFKGVDYTALSNREALMKLTGRKVEVRYLPNRLDVIEIFHDGLHVCSGVPASSLSPEDREEFQRDRARVKADGVRRHHTADRMRDSHPGATKIKRAKHGSRMVVEVDDSVFEGGAKELAELIGGPDNMGDGDQLRLL